MDADKCRAGWLSTADDRGAVYRLRTRLRGIRLAETAARSKKTVLRGADPAGELKATKKSLMPNRFQIGSRLRFAQALRRRIGKILSRNQMWGPPRGVTHPFSGNIGWRGRATRTGDATSPCSRPGPESGDGRGVPGVAFHRRQRRFRVAGRDAVAWARLPLPGAAVKGEGGRPPGWAISRHRGGGGGEPAAAPGAGGAEVAKVLTGWSSREILTERSVRSLGGGSDALARHQFGAG